MKKVLILGGTKFFGKRLVLNLVHSGADVTIATRGLTQDPFQESVTRVRIERQDRSSLEQALGSGEWDVVYDQTCYSPKEAADAYEVLCGRVRRYVFTSSMAVYSLGVKKTESDFDPSSFPYSLGSRDTYKGMEGYQKAKREAEAVLFHQATVPAAAVRLPLVIGPDDYTDRLRFFAKHVQSGTPIGITNPEARLSFISSEEAAHFLQWAGEGAWAGAINASSNGCASHSEIIGHIEQMAGAKARIVPVAEPPNQSPYDFPDCWTLDNSKAALLGFRFKHLDDYLPDLLQTYIK